MEGRVGKEGSHDVWVPSVAENVETTEGGTCHSGLQLWLGLAKEAGQGQFTPEWLDYKAGATVLSGGRWCCDTSTSELWSSERAQMSGIWELNLPSGCSLPSRRQSLLTGWNVHSCICCVVCQDSPWFSVIFQLHDACWEFSALKIHHFRVVIAFKFIFKDDNTRWHFCCCLINHIAG